MIYRFGDFELDDELFELRRDGTLLPAEAKVVDVLLHLVRNRHRVVSKTEFMETVWHDVVVRDRIVDQAVYTARRLLADDANAPWAIQTVRGRGHRWIAGTTWCAIRTGPLRSEASLIGRSAELTMLHEHVRAVGEGRGRLVLIVGEPGIGKTHLLEELLATNKEQVTACHLTRCPEVEGAGAFWPWADLISAVRANIPDTDWESYLSAFPELGQLVRGIDPLGRWRMRRGSGEFGTERFRLIAAATRFWRSLASEIGGLVLAIDDAHRADLESLLLLKAIASDIATVPLLLLATVRPAEAAAPLRELESSAAYVVHLRGLGRSDVAELARAIDGNRPSDTEVAQLLDYTGGNPLYLRILRRLGALPTVDQRTVFGLIPALVGQVPDRVLSLLGVASVLGPTFDLRPLLTLSEGEPTEARGDLSLAIEQGLVVEQTGAQFRFSHVFVRDAIYSSLDRDKRIAMHARVAEWLVADGGVNREHQIAHHAFLGVEILGTEVAYKRLRQAACVAMEQCAYDAAREHLQAAADLNWAPSEDEDAALKVALGECQIRVGERESGERTLVEVARNSGRSGAHRHLAAAALSLAPGLLAIETGVHDPVIAGILRLALDMTPEADSEMKSLLRARLALALHGLPGSRKLREELLAAAAASGAAGAGRPSLPPSSRARVELARCVALWGPGDVEGRARTAREVGEMCERCGEYELLAVSYALSIACAHEVGDGELVERIASTIARVVDGHEIEQARWYPPHYAAVMAIESGRFDLADSLIAECRTAAGNIGSSNADNSVAAMVGVVLAHRGNYIPVAAMAQEMSERYPGIWTWKAAECVALLRAGRLREGRALFSLLKQQLSMIPDDVMWLSSVALMSDAAADLGDRGAAEQLRSMLEPFPERIASIGYAVSGWGAMARLQGRILGLLGETRRAEERFAEAWRLHERARSPVWNAYVSLDWAEALLRGRRSRDADRAGKRLKEAASQGRRFGLRWVGARVERLWRQKDLSQ